MRHVKLADESFLISPSPPPAKSYLNRQKIIDVVLIEKAGVPSGVVTGY